VRDWPAFLQRGDIETVEGTLSVSAVVTSCNYVSGLVVGETGVDCDGNSVSWGYATNYMVTYRKIWCEPCE
jgi:hypothetical protein